MSETSKEAAFQEIFEHAVMRLQSQREDISNIRNRASISAAITGLVATVFATAIGSDQLSQRLVGDFFLGFSLPAMLLFLVLSSSIAMSGLVIVHQRDFTFSFNTRKMIENLKGKNAQDFFDEYANDGEWYFNDNESQIREAQSQLFWAVLLGWTQIIPWLLLI